MNTQTQPKRYKVWLKRTAITLVTLVAVVLAFYVFVVPPITGWAIKRALGAAGLSGAEYELRAVSLYRLDVVNVRVAKDDASAIGAVAIDFTPWSLMRGRVDRVRLIGAELHLRVRDGAIDYGGLNPLVKKKAGETQPGDEGSATAAVKDEDLSTLPVNEVTLEASSVVVDVHGWKARLAAAGSIKKVEGAPSAMFDEPMNRAITQHLEVDFKLDSALVPAYIQGWIGPDLDDADIMIHLGPQPDAAPAPAGSPLPEGEGVKRQIKSLPFILAQLSARETAAGPTYRVNVQAATAQAAPRKDGKPHPNTAGLSFDARFGSGFALKSLTGQGAINDLNLGFATLDMRSRFQAQDGRFSLSASSFKVTGPEGFAMDANLSLSNGTLVLPLGAQGKSRVVEAGCDFACTLTARPPVPGALADVLGSVVDMKMATHGRITGTYSLDAREYQAGITFENLAMAAKPQGSKLIGTVDLKAQKLFLGHGRGGTDVRLASLRLFASQPGVPYPEGEIERVSLPAGAAMFQIGHPGAAESGFWWRKPSTEENASLSLGRAVIRAHGAVDVPMGNGKLHGADVRVRLPFGLTMDGKTGETTITLPVAPLEEQAAATQPAATQSATDKRFLTTDRPRLQWLVKSPYLAMSETSQADSSLAGALEIKGTGPVVIRLPGKMPQSAAEWLSQTRVDATVLRLEASPTGEARMSAEAKAAKSSRVSFSGPATLDIAMKPRTANAALDQTAFLVALNLPRFTANLSATDSLTLALKAGTQVTPVKDENEPGEIGLLMTPDIALEVHETRLPTYGVQGLGGKLSVKGNTQVSAESVRFSGRVDVNDLGVNLPKYEVKIAHASVSLPISTGYAHKAKNPWVVGTKPPLLERGDGAINFPDIVYKGQTQAPITGKVSFYNADLSAAVDWEPIPGAKLNITSRATVAPALKATAKVTLPSYNQPDSLAIARFLEKAGVARAATSEISGTMGAWAQVNYADEKLTGSGEVSIKDITINDRLSAVEVTGLTGKITLAELFPLRSEGGQRITARMIKLNEVQLHDADVTLALESPTTVLLERTRARMGESGILGLTAFRYRAGKAEIDTDLLLENVNIKDLFLSFAKDKLEGDGGIWGRVPIVIAPGSPQPLVIQEGFLFARPGDVGWFKILDDSTNTMIDNVADGVAVDEAIKGESVDNARAGIKGLKNFSYDKLTVTFEKRNGKTLGIVRASGKGRGLGPLVPPLVPTITVENIDQALGTALNYWYQWSKPAGPPPKPSPLDDMF